MTIIISISIFSIIICIYKYACARASLPLTASSRP